MFCSNCGKELPDSAVFCTNCGAKLKNTEYINGHASWTMQYNPATLSQPQLPMKWFNYLIYFSLFLSAAEDLILGILNVFGVNILTYGLDSPAEIYSAYNGLRILDIGYGAVSIVFALIILYVRHALAHKKKNAPEMFYIYHITATFLSLSYDIFASVITDGRISGSIGGVIGGIAGTVLFIALNIIYFNKRKHLFVN